MDSRPSGLEEDMVVRVATVIKKSLGDAMNAKPLLGDATSGDWYSDGECGSVDLEVVARAAIEALKVPTEAMTESAMKVLAKSGMVEEPMGADGLVLNDCYRAMIDAALTSRP